MYVRRCPRISASSRTPPSDIRTNSRLSAFAIDSPIEVLPVPGGPIKRQDRAGPLVDLDAALLAQLGDGDVLDDPILDVVETGVVGVEHLARVDRVEHLVRACAPRDCEQPVEVAADHLRLGRALAHPLEARELLVGLLAHLLRHPGLLDLRPVLLDDGRVVLAELLADRVHLLAQQELALLLVHPGVDVLADPLADLHQRETLALELERQL